MTHQMNPLQRAVIELSGVAPREWETFLNAVRGLQIEYLGNLVRAPIDELQRQQGRVQGIRDLLDILANARNTASGK